MDLIGSDTDEEGGDLDGEVENRYPIPISNEIVLKGHTKAYTVELEAELNQLKEENAHLRRALAELERKRKPQMFHRRNSLAAHKHTHIPGRDWCLLYDILRVKHQAC